MSRFISEILSTTSTKLRSLRFYEFFYTTQTPDTTQSNTQTTQENNTQSTDGNITESTEGNITKSTEANIKESTEANITGSPKSADIVPPAQQSSDKMEKETRTPSFLSVGNLIPAETNLTPNSASELLVDIEERLHSLECCLSGADSEYCIRDNSLPADDAKPTPSIPPVEAVTLPVTMSDSSFHVATSKSQKVISMKNHQRQLSRESAKNQPKRKTDKIKQLHRTPSSREPKQRKLLKKEDLKSYDAEDLLEIMSEKTDEQISQETVDNDEEPTAIDHEQASRSLSADLKQTKLDNRPSCNSSTEVNLSQKTEDTIVDYVNSEEPAPDADTRTNDPLSDANAKTGKLKQTKTKEVTPKQVEQDVTVKTNDVENDIGYQKDIQTLKNNIRREKDLLKMLKNETKPVEDDKKTDSKLRESENGKKEDGKIGNETESSNATSTEQSQKRVRSKKKRKSKTEMEKTNSQTGGQTQTSEETSNLGQKQRKTEAMRPQGKLTQEETKTGQKQGKTTGPLVRTKLDKEQDKDSRRPTTQQRATFDRLDTRSSGKSSRASTGTQTRRKNQGLEMRRDTTRQWNNKTQAGNTSTIQENKKETTNTKNTSQLETIKLRNKTKQIKIKQTRSVTKVIESIIKHVKSDRVEEDASCCRMCKRLLKQVNKSHCIKCGKLMVKTSATANIQSEPFGEHLVPNSAALEPDAKPATDERTNGADDDDVVKETLDDESKLTHEARHEDGKQLTNTEHDNEGHRDKKSARENENEANDNDQKPAPGDANKEDDHAKHDSRKKSTETIEDKNPSSKSTDEKIKMLIKPEEIPVIPLKRDKSYASVVKLSLDPDQMNKNTDNRTNDNKSDGIEMLKVTWRRDYDETKDNKENRTQDSETNYSTQDVANSTPDGISSSLRALHGSMEDNKSHEKQLDGPQEIVMESQTEADYYFSEADYASRGDIKDMHDMMEAYYKPENQREDKSKKLAAISSKIGFVNEIRQKTHQLIREQFPLKIQAINEMKSKLTQVIVQQTKGAPSGSIFNLAQAALNNSNNHSEYLERKFLTVDENLAQLINEVKTCVQILIQDINNLKLWICLVLSNETTSAQVNNDSMVDELLHEIETAERETVGMQDDILAYYVKRNNVITEIFKYPYTQGEHILEAINYKQYIDLQIILGVMRNKYNILHNLILTQWKSCLITQ